MSSFRSNLKKVLVPDAVIEIKPTQAANTFYIDLYEDGAKATLKHLRLTHIKESDTCITFDVTGDDKFKTYSPYFRKMEDSDFNKRCDFIIARKEGGVWRVYFGDLKSTKVVTPKIIRQLSSSKLFFEYVLKILQLECGCNSKIHIDYCFRYICIHDNNASSSAGTLKSPTNIKNSAPYPINCRETGKQLIVVPVAVLPQGKAKVSFNQFCSI